MLSKEIIVREFAQGVVGGIQNNIRTKSVTKYGPSQNTGKTADSIFWRYDGRILEIGSTFGWITVLEDGRPPGKFPPPDAMRGYVESKLVPEGISRDSLAYLIGKKISEKGSLLYQQGGNSGILSEYLNEEYIRENLIEPLREMVIEATFETIFKE